MKVSHLSIENFRGIKHASLLLPDHAVLIGDNNTGKSTILEALDLVLGPDRLSRPSPIDEHDFHLGSYLAKAAAAPAAKAVTVAEVVPKADAPQIIITATVTGLSEDPRTHFPPH